MPFFLYLAIEYFHISKSGFSLNWIGELVDLYERKFYPEKGMTTLMMANISVFLLHV